jgi:hypothetical protein
MMKHNSVIKATAAFLCWTVIGVNALAQHENHGGQKPPAQERSDQHPSAQDNQQQEIQRQSGSLEMPVMMQNHLLAMAYLQNMANFARLLRDQVQPCNSVNGAFARDVTAEIRRSFDQMERYHQDQLNMMRDSLRFQKSGTQAGAAMNHPSAQANEPSDFKALREIGANRGAITPTSPAVHCDLGSQSVGDVGGQARPRVGGQRNDQLDCQMTEEMRRMGECLTQLSASLIELERETGAANPNPKWVLEHTNTILKLLEGISTMRGGRNADK